MAGGHITKAAITLAKLCKDTLLEDGLKAKAAAEKGVSTKALENIVEANTYLSGIGFESSGLAAVSYTHLDVYKRQLYDFVDIWLRHALWC